VNLLTRPACLKVKNPRYSLMAARGRGIHLAGVGFECGPRTMRSLVTAASQNGQHSIVSLYLASCHWLAVSPNVNRLPSPSVIARNLPVMSHLNAETIDSHVVSHHAPSNSDQRWRPASHRSKMHRSKHQPVRRHIARYRTRLLPFLGCRRDCYLYTRRTREMYGLTRGQALHSGAFTWSNSLLNVTHASENI